MVPKVQVDRVVKGVFRGRVTSGSVDLTEPVEFGSIAEAVKFFGEDVPADWARFAEVWYADVSIGMRPLSSLAAQPEQIARELVDLAAAVWTAEEELAALGRTAKLPASPPST